MLKTVAFSFLIILVNFSSIIFVCSYVLLTKQWAVTGRYSYHLILLFLVAGCVTL